MANNRAHWLTQPTFAATAAFIGIWLSGVGLMATASIFLVAFGFVVALLSGVLFIWLYAADYRDVCLRNPRRDGAPPKKELAAMAIVIVIVFTVPTMVWFAQPDWFGPKSRLVYIHSE